VRKKQFISDLKGLGPNERFQSAFLVQSKEVRQKRSGDLFLSMRLADRTGSVDSKMWDNVAAVAETFESGNFVDVRGKVQVFNGQHQIIAHKLRVVPEVHVYLGDFIPHTEFDIESMYAEVLSAIEGFSNPSLKRLMLSIFRDPEFAMLYKRAPAARGMHHARIGGLLEHVSSMLKLAKLVASHYPEVNSDLLACGVLMHDVGKMFELMSDRTFEYTDEGRLLGHIAIGSAWLERRCDAVDGFPARLKTLLLHMVLSHHGKLEYGSPQVPLFPEALALHFVDDLDSKLEMMRAARAEMPDGTIWSPFHRGLGRFLLDKGAFLRRGESSAEGRDANSRRRRRKSPPARRALRPALAGKRPTTPRPSAPGSRRSRNKESKAVVELTSKATAEGATGSQPITAGKDRLRGNLEPSAAVPPQFAPPEPDRGSAYGEQPVQVAKAKKARPRRTTQEPRPPRSPGSASASGQPPPPPLPRQPTLAGLESEPGMSE
jgi:3'-5' exoribonuclease